MQLIAAVSGVAVGAAYGVLGPYLFRSCALFLVPVAFAKAVCPDTALATQNWQFGSVTVNESDEFSANGQSKFCVKENWHRCIEDERIGRLWLCDVVVNVSRL